MNNTPKSFRLQLAICGRINAGKSTLLNLISGQDSAITSPERGTTTDVVEKSMELRPLGAAVLLDTAGVDDDSTLGAKRLEKRQNKNYGADPEYQAYVAKTPIVFPLIPLKHLENVKWIV